MIKGKPITIILSAANHYTAPTVPKFNKGELVNLGFHKRLKGLIKNVSNSENAITLTLRNGYMAAPKSKLRRKTVFSKIKPRILNPKK